MRETDDTVENEPTDDNEDVVTDVSQLTAESPLVTLLGTHAKTRILHVMLDAGEPLNPSRICDRAGFGSAHSWYSHKDDLLATGLIEQTGAAGNSPLFALAEDDPRVEALHKLFDLTNAALMDATGGDE
jgi:hypothetical protein